MRFLSVGVLSVFGFALVAGAPYLVAAYSPSLFDRRFADEAAERQPFQQSNTQISQDALATDRRMEGPAGSRSIASSVVGKSDFQRKQWQPSNSAQPSLPARTADDAIVEYSQRNPSQQASDRGLRVSPPGMQGDGRGSQSRQYRVQPQQLQLSQLNQAPSPEPGANSAQPAMPDAPKMMILIRTTVLALNEANKTNNYSVLHQLGTQGFQQANSPERLSELFSAMRGRDLDLGPVALITPKLFREPVIDEHGRLLLTGFFPSRPEQVNFDLAFEMVDGDWRLFGIGVNTSREVPAAAAK